MTEVKVRKPKIPRNWVTRWALSYDKRWMKWRDSLPESGCRIEITWLPPAVNAPKETNCYIGAIGKFYRGFEGLNPNWHEGFYLVYDNGSTLIMNSGDFNYIITEQK